MVETIYCSDCKFWYSGEWSSWCIQVKRTKKTPERLETIYYNNEKLNKNNDCPFFVKKHWLKQLLGW